MITFPLSSFIPLCPICYFLHPQTSIPLLDLMKKNRQNSTKQVIASPHIRYKISSAIKRHFRGLMEPPKNWSDSSQNNSKIWIKTQKNSLMWLGCLLFRLKTNKHGISKRQWKTKLHQRSQVNMVNWRHQKRI